MERHTGFDNAKLICIFFTVLSHLDPNSSPGYAMWHKLFALPGMVFLSGFFGKSFRGEASRLQDLLSMLFAGPILLNLLLSFLDFIYSGILLLMARYTGGEQQAQALEVPVQIMDWERNTFWYLPALLLWRLASIPLRQLRYPLLTSVALAVLSSHTAFEGAALLRSNVFRCLPFYSLGLYLEEADLTVLDTSRSRLLAGLCLAGSLAGCIMLYSNTTKDWLLFNQRIYSWNLVDHAGLVCYYLIASAQLISVVTLAKAIPFSLLPQGHPRSTLAIYEFHWLFVSVLGGNLPFSFSFSYISDEYAPLRLMTDLPFSLWIPLSHLVALVVCWLCGSRLMWRMLNKLAAPPLGWLFQQTPDDGATDEEKAALLVPADVQMIKKYMQ